MNTRDHQLKIKLRRMDRAELETHLNQLVQSEREMLHEILLTIKEIDQRQLFLDAGYQSLYEYLKDKCHYSNGSAQRRIDAARLLADVPELGEQIKSGAIKLGQTSLIQRTIRARDHRDRIRTTTAEKAEILQTIAHMTERESEQRIAAFFGVPVQIATREKVQADSSVRIEMTLTAEQYERFQLAQQLVSHSLVSKDPTEFFDFAVQKIIKFKSPSSRPRTKSREAEPRKRPAAPRPAAD